jgi:hypothetical protein
MAARPSPQLISDFGKRMNKSGWRNANGVTTMHRRQGGDATCPPVPGGLRDREITEAVKQTKVVSGTIRLATEHPDLGAIAADADQPRRRTDNGGSARGYQDLCEELTAR